MAKIPTSVHCHCGFVVNGEATPGLGDLLSIGLRKLGVTPGRYTAAKAAVGLKRRCGCHGRQLKLNAIGRKLGIGTS